MGLDQFAYSYEPKKGLKIKVGRKSVEIEKPTNKIGDKQVDFECNGKKIHYWRKHPNLQGWMELLYRTKGGEKTFNCVNVRLELADIKCLELAIKGKHLPETEGFFFGEDDGSEIEDDLKFCKKAKKELKKGNIVYYSSWW